MPRPPRRYRAWPWLLLVAAVVAAACFGGYSIYQDHKPEPFAEEHTITLPDLAPAGLHRMFVADGRTYAVGQHTGGSVEVVAVAFGSKIHYTYRSAGGRSPP